MGIGYLLLYVALAVVALWLVAELLFQNRAPLHWRGLALAGFLAVAGGMAIGSVPVIGAGAALFAIGQTFVTLSVKRGYAAGWSLRAADGSLPGPLAKVPLLGALTGGGAAVAATAVVVEQVGEVGAVEEPPAPVEETAVEQTAAFAMQELAADGVYAAAYYEQQQTELLHAVPQQDAYAAYQEPQPQQQPYGYDQQQHQQWQPAFGYDQTYAAYQQQEPYGYDQQPQPDPYAAYQQPQQQPYGYDQQQHQQHQQWQPEQPVNGIPQQPQYDQYGYQQHPPTWQQQS
ncbi:hypothetical protein GCM10009639_66670 [Kitasatospora putterlickiae]|uniref:Uncharacterized protein n=1 Tax=Kitasatospora putterlickiae TaxID=221725 RepID=A0ABP4JAB4_9ACTN